jgi:hypothetical protein
MATGRKLSAIVEIYSPEEVKRGYLVSVMQRKPMNGESALSLGQPRR